MSLCQECHEKPIYIKKRNLCNTCYYKWQRENPCIFKSEGQQRKTATKNLIKKYGMAAFTDLVAVGTKPFWNLTDFGNKYEMTRERARQLFTLIVGKRGRAVRTKKTNRIKRELMVGQCDPRNHIKDMSQPVGRGTIGEIRVMEKAQELGFSVKPSCGKRDININGFYVEVKTAFTSRRMNSYNKYNHFHFSARKTQIDNNDFFIFFANNGRERFFIVPTKEIKTKAKSEKIAIFITEHPSNHPNAKNRFYEYENAWHLLLPIANTEKFGQYLRGNMEAVAPRAAA